ncbi:hypothetical protein HanRHA438_Chr03g0110311 [Helianthus annuus]|uniref:Uncharacterized protein n=1 Tax=Helianthus annuus TaxID=4232 RepID=A0A9K3JFB8_HELAN|nr:hypothetical protein HanXRQr2_Chr03g0099261 [Helianthus annuus]KAJ0592239.1 hypothetical protein HanHA300_Chr03g0082611 [Helianthus annuus]KAJ0599732.1 hypothetical protein HanIR_Chr03g0108291 [Helianthus annuus]KAJ0607227.1 hypothetical protein HanHA89_Chr03g0094131 [Helianthus annuus]KAJ0767285.1 hypothetical protein HanLR1_Chr03g0087411 [Helianthus annuus]
MEKKRSIMADAKHKLDTKATLNVSEKKRKLMGQPMGPAPSKSAIDLSVFRKESFNILDDLFEESAGRKSSAKATGSWSRRSTIRSSKPTAPDISSILNPKSPPTLFLVNHLLGTQSEELKGKGPEGVAKSGIVEKVQPSTLL